jgi:hypothetical protein
MVDAQAKRDGGFALRHKIGAAMALNTKRNAPGETHLNISRKSIAGFE